MKSRTALITLIGLLPILLLAALTRATANEPQLHSLHQSQPISLSELQSDTLFIHGVVSPTVQGVTVVLIDGNDSPIDGVQTDELGRFAFSGIPDGVYQLGVWDEDSHPVELEGSYFVDQNNSSQSIVIMLPETDIGRMVEANQGVIQVAIRTADTGEFIGGNVSLFNVNTGESYGYRIYSGLESARFANLDTDSIYRVFVKPEFNYEGNNYLDTNYDGFDVIESQSKLAEFTEVSFSEGSTALPVEVTVNRSGVIVGNIVDASTNEPVRGYLTVSLFQNNERLDHKSYYQYASGNNFVFNRNLYGGDVTVKVRPPGNSLYAPHQIVINTTKGVTTSNITIPLPKSGAIEGQISNSSGTPIAGLHLSVLNEDGLVVADDRTNGDGVYSIAKSLGTSDYRLLIGQQCISDGECYRHTFYGGGADFEEASPIPVVAEQTTSNINMVIDKLPIIRGTVKAADSGEVIDSYIRLYSNPYGYREQSHSIYTQYHDDLEFVFSVEPGSYYLDAGHIYNQYSEKKRYVDEFFDDKTKVDADPIMIAAGDDISIEFTLDVGGILTGIVTDGKTNEPIEGAEVELTELVKLQDGEIDINNARRTTDENGKYTFTGLAEGNHYLSVHKQNYGVVYYPEKPIGPIPEYFSISEGITKTLDFALQPYAKVSGKVTNSVNGTPIEGAEVNIANRSNSYYYPYRTIYTDLDGSYEIEFDANQIDGDKVELEIKGPCGYSPWGNHDPCIYIDNSLKLDVRNGDILTDIDLALDKKALIKGVVTDEKTGDPLLGTIQIYDKISSGYNSPVATDYCYLGNGNECDNSYELWVEPGTYYASALANSYLTEYFDDAYLAADATPIAVVANEEKIIDFALHEGDELVGTVVGKKSKLPLSNINVQLFNSISQSEPINYAYTNENGEFQFNKLPPGDYYLFFNSNGSYTDAYYSDAQKIEGATKVTIVKDIGAEIVIEMEKGGELEAHFIDIDTGNLIPNVETTLHYEDGRMYQNLVYPISENSSVIIQGIKEGSYFIRARAYGYVPEFVSQADRIDDAKPYFFTSGEREAITVPLRKTGSISVTISADTETPIGNGWFVLALYQQDTVCGGRILVDTKTINIDQNGAEPFNPVTQIFSGLNPSHTYEVVANRKGDLPFAEAVQEGVTVNSGKTSEVAMSFVDGGTIGGKVQAADTHDPLERVKVTFFEKSIDSSGNESYTEVGWDWTNADGSYRSRGLPSGTYFATYETVYAIDTFVFMFQQTYPAKYYQSEIFDGIHQFGSFDGVAPTPILVYDTTETVVNVDLERGGTIFGSVSSSPYSSHLKITAYLKTADGLKKVSQGMRASDSSYQYLISGLPDGEYYLKYEYVPPIYSTNHGYKTHWYGSTQFAEDSTPVFVTREITPTLTHDQMEQGGSIVGTIDRPQTNVNDHSYNYQNRQPVYTRVDLYNENGKLVESDLTTSNYGFHGLWAGTYYVLFNTTNHQTYGYCNSETYFGEWYGGVTQFEDATPIVIQGKEQVSNINGKISKDNSPPTSPNQSTSAPLHKITGYISIAGKPLAGVGIKTDTGSATITKLDGSYTLYLKDGTHTLTPFKNGYTFDPARKSITINSSDIADQDFTTTALPTGSIEGIVSEDDSNAKLNGIDILAYAENGSSWQFEQKATTDADGSYKLDNLAPADYKLLFRAPLQTHKSEYYDNAKSFSQGASVTVSSGAELANIDASLEKRPEAAILIEEAVGIASYTNPDTGLVTLTTNRGHGENVTISRKVICESGDAADVQLIIGSKAFAMTDKDENGNYSVTLNIPGDVASDSTQNMSVQYVCSGFTETANVGKLVLYDPSGVITDITTGKPIEGAKVTLHRVAGAIPDTTSSTNDCRTVDTRPETSSGQFGAWSGVPAADLSAGHPVDAAFDTLNGQALFSPAVPTQVTDADGKYAWDVAEGCWYVVVEAEGYPTQVSPIVGVPPAVLDLDIALGTPSHSLYLPVILR